MERILVTKDELVELLNKELSKREDSEGYSFTSGILRLQDKDKNGCNWSGGTLRGSGVPTKPMEPAAVHIVAEAKKKYNLK
jgi:hypothetical protein